MTQHLRQNLVPHRHVAPAAEKAWQEVISCRFSANDVQSSARTGATAFASRPLASLPPVGIEPTTSGLANQRSWGPLSKEAPFPLSYGGIPRCVGSFLAVGSRRIRGILAITDEFRRSQTRHSKLFLVERKFNPRWIYRLAEKLSLQLQLSESNEKPREKERAGCLLSCSFSRGFHLFGTRPRKRRPLALSAKVAYENL